MLVSTSQLHTSDVLTNLDNMRNCYIITSVPAIFVVSKRAAGVESAYGFCLPSKHYTRKRKIVLQTATFDRILADLTADLDLAIYR